MNMRSWRRKAAALGAVTGTAMIGVPFVLSGTAYAAVAASPAITTTGPVNVGQGQGSSQPVTLTFHLTGGFTSGSYVAVDVAENGSVAPATTSTATAGITAENNGGPTTAVTFAATPTVKVTPDVGTTTAAPAVAASLVTNPNDTIGPAGSPGKDQLNLTLGTTDATASDSYTVTVSGVTLAAGPAAALGTIAASDTYYSVSQNKALAAVAIANMATVVGYTETILTPMGIQRNGSTALPSVTFTESSAGGTFKTGTYSYALPAGDTFAGTPSVTATGGGTVATTPAPAISGGKLTFTYTQSTTGPATITISGLSANPTTALGTAEVATLANTTTATTVLTESYGVVTAVNPAIAGVSAADTSVQVFNTTVGGPTTKTPSIVLATDSDPEDALSASYLVNYLNGGTPGTASGLLLTDPGSLPAAVQQGMINHCVSTVYILGGPQAISTSVEQQVKAIQNSCTGTSGMQVIRYYGQTQYDTNQAVLSAFPPSNAHDSFSLPYGSEATYDPVGGGESASTTSTSPAATAIVASGDYNAYQDALSAGALSAATGAPVILTSTTSLSTTASNLLSTGGFKQVILMGGPKATSTAVEQSIAALGLSVFRVAGQDATQTAALFATLVQTVPLAGFATSDPTGVFLARGNGFQDALSFAQLGAIRSTPILLTTNNTTLGQYLTGYLNSEGAAGVNSVSPIGGNQALTPAALQAAVNALAAK